MGDYLDDSGSKMKAIIRKYSSFIETLIKQILAVFIKNPFIQTNLLSQEPLHIIVMVVALLSHARVAYARDTVVDVC